MASMSLRLDDDLMADLQLVAQCDGESANKAVQDAIRSWVAARRQDPTFQLALQCHIERAQRLAGVEGGR